MATAIVTIDLGFVNAYLVKAGERYILFDTGLASQWARLASSLAAAGCEPSKLALVVLTHRDPDHAGNAARLQAEWKVPLAAHPADARVLESGAAPIRTGRGPLSKAVMRIMGALRSLRAARGREEGLKVDLLLEDGQSLGPWGLEARVLHLPGHTSGSIAVLTAGGELLAGDVFANRRRPDTSPFVEDLEAYRGSVLKAKSIASMIKIVYPGHGRSFPGSAIEAIEI